MTNDIYKSVDALVSQLRGHGYDSIASFLNDAKHVGGSASETLYEIEQVLKQCRGQIKEASLIQHIDLLLKWIDDAFLAIGDRK
ncbi:MAG: hypothetical protein JNL11_08220 [Bdellovibrionaceae bacterium]|nr:hypothetical protein [Pseudobdellovibrionaceae bacterium]